MDLETIFQNYFRSKRPFKKNGDLSFTGSKAYGRLIDLIYNLEQIGVIKKADTVIKEIDKIIDNNV